MSSVLLQFETSGKWPDDLVAIQHIKAAFHIKLATLLRENCSLEAVATPKYVDVMKVRSTSNFNNNVWFCITQNRKYSIILYKCLRNETMKTHVTMCDFKFV